MGDPARDEKPNVRARGIGRIERVSGNVEVVARVIEHHQRDDETAQQVDHVEARHLRVHAKDNSACRSGFSPTLQARA